LENKKKKRNPLPPSWAESSPRPRPLPPPTPAIPSPSAHRPAHSALAPAHADTPAPLVSPRRPRSRPLPLARGPHRSAASSSSPRTASPRSPPATVLAPSPRPSHRRTEFGTAPSLPLDRVLTRYRPRREVSSSPLCGINSGAEHLTGVRRAPVAEQPELFQLKCLSHASGAVTHLNRNNPLVPQI
jgi:hypothetical protein